MATLIAAGVVLAIARVTGADAVGRVFDHFDPIWIGTIAVAELLTYPSYMLAYRSLARVHGHDPIDVGFVARVVVAGFGPFALGGGFAIDKQALHALDDDERSARVRALALGALEWAVLAPVTCVVSIVFLAEDANILPSLLWPWAIAVPLGFGLGLWASNPRRAARLANIGGKHRDWLAHLLEGVGTLRTLIVSPAEFGGAWFGTLLYWVTDIAAFYAGLRTFGLEPGLGKVIIAYATGYAATRRSLPLGGAGLTEVLMTYSLYWVREPLAPALAAVVAYRIFNFLLVAIPALIAHRQLAPMLSSTDRLRRGKRTSGESG